MPSLAYMLEFFMEEPMSRALTIPEHLYSRLAAEARSEGLGSVEEWLQKMVTGTRRRSERARSTTIGHALDEFIGDWSTTEAEELLRETQVFEQIDESFWK